MAASVQSHARIRLNFVNLPIESAWMLIDYKKLPLISDIVCEINKRHFGGNHDLTLSLQGSCLPLQEKSLLLRDEDVVTVRAEGQDDLSTSNRSTGKVSDTPTDITKKRKRKHEESDESCEERRNRKEHHEHRHHEHKRSKKLKKEKRRDEDKKREAEKKREKEKKERRKEKEQLQEIADIVSTLAVGKGDLSKGSSRNEYSGNSTERASKRMKVDLSQSTEKIHEDTTVLYQGPSTSYSEPVQSRESKIIDNENENAEVKKQKKKRIRKHRKRKNKSPSLEGFDAVGMTPVQESSSRLKTSPAFQNVANETAKTKETQWDKQVNKYQGNPVDVNATYFGSLPDKLLQPKYYRHQYRNLRQYNVEPNKHIKYPSDPETEDKEEQQHYDQYNFLCSTRYSEFQESNSQESGNIASPDVVNDNINNSNVVCQSSSTPNNSRHTEEKTGNSSVRSDIETSKINGDLSYEHETGTLSNKKKSKDLYSNQNKSNSYNTVSHNGYSGYSEDNTSPVNRAAPTSLVQSKLPNGVTVFSRQRKSFPKAEMFSKEEQLNTVATNRSFIYQNPVESETVGNGEFVVDPEEVLEAEKMEKDYTSFPALAGPPRIGDKIAYRILEMSSEYTPEVSDYKEAEVISFDHTTQHVQLRNLLKSDSNRSPWEDKFHMSIEDGDTLWTNEQPDSDEAMLPWSSLLEPRLVS